MEFLLKGIEETAQETVKLVLDMKQMMMETIYFIVANGMGWSFIRILSMVLINWQMGTHTRYCPQMILAFLSYLKRENRQFQFAELANRERGLDPALSFGRCEEDGELFNGSPSSSQVTRTAISLCRKWAAARVYLGRITSTFTK